ncbi:hypothetical protein TanjilG_27377 [Lupinus angustifolius]|uniref:Fucosyltransferase n=1 Tax=Lupinus angustifolius TaxID=3871 RepID=A0A394DD55_LUPAN|nr:PREDICTED: galactoside 2-alpha-L-fucosyltransferase-like [Lupinus angustifolius]OIW21014.1 hypothetical protein TanjilG_27377 [Lupinus angustifolius]
MFPDQRPVRSSRFAATKFGSKTMSLIKFLALFIIAIPLLMILRLTFPNPSSYLKMGFDQERTLNRMSHNGTLIAEHGSADSSNMSKDKFLGGLLAHGHHEGSCLSRYQSSLYRKTSPYKPSSYLISKLRSYEELHKRCGPYTESYNRTLKQLQLGQTQSISSANSECKYVVWVSFSGLGNKILTIASAFLYAILTNRVLLVDPGKEIHDLFCEPFPDNSWLLPNNFPLKSKFDLYEQKSPDSYGNMLKNNILSTSSESLPSFLYLHLAHDYKDHDKLFFCDQHQKSFSEVPWLIMKTDNYFVPSLFLSPSFEPELIRLFPNKSTVFHHLGRYLFHPTNHVWGLITRYYKAYLEKADERIGIQIRVFEIEAGPHKHVMDQILACTLQQKVLPEVDKQKTFIPPPRTSSTKAVLMTSLSFGYFDNLRTIYWEHPTITGDVIGVYQPSHEEYQQTDKKSHNRKAWAEMYLLSLTDVLVTSAWSTFGYVAQGLGGLKPWILYKPENHTTPNPACGRAKSMEPCFHAPPFYDCKRKTGADTGNLVPHVRHCEDMSWGLTLVDTDSNNDL